MAFSYGGADRSRAQTENPGAMCLRMVPSLSAAWGACACGSGQYIEAPVLHQPICKSYSFYDGGAVGWQERGDGLAEVVHTTISKLPQLTYVGVTCAGRQYPAKLVLERNLFLLQ